MFSSPVITFLLASLMALALAPFMMAQGGHQKKSDEYAFQQPTAEEMKAMQQRWAESMKPGKYHAWLGQLIGHWDVEARLFYGSQGEPQKGKGKSAIEWKVEDKWLSWEYDYELAGSKTRSFGIHGYDNFKQKFVSVTFDNNSTALSRFEGVLDQSGTALHLWGTVDEPMTGEHDKMAEGVVRILDANRFLLEVHDLAIGDDSKVLEFEFTRAKE
ncbi:MAG TPA: DUF1579 family protein [Acidobacteriota bacterium]|nr:DUF1579 family protein [Acidobacteriota bacterium]